MLYATCLLVDLPQSKFFNFDRFYDLKQKCTMNILIISILYLTIDHGSASLANIRNRSDNQVNPDNQETVAPPITAIDSNDNINNTNQVDFIVKLRPETKEKVYEAPPIFPVEPRNFDNGTAHFIPRKVLLNRTNAYDNVGVYQFLGVPYAMPPIGKNRFQLPKPMFDVSGLRQNVQNYRPSCMQFRMPVSVNPLANQSAQLVSENCLYLNIFAPFGNDEEKLPVLVVIPGDGFDFANANQFDGSYLAYLTNVIVVVIQYRVGVFGFLYNNAGIYDQLAALSYIRQNIEEFGGDPEQITLFGHYTGSMSITLLLNSPFVHGATPALFQKVILTGGVIVPHWMIEKQARHATRKQVLLEKLRTNYEDSLQYMNALKLVKKSGFGWRPTYDPLLFGNLSQLNFPPQVTGYMLGATENEGFQYLLYIKLFRPKLYDRIVANNVTEAEYVRLADEMEKIFYQNGPVRGGLKSSAAIEVNRTAFVRYAGYRMIERPMKDYGQKLYLANKYTVRYKLDHKPKISNAPDFLNSSSFGDELLYLFGLRLYDWSEYESPSETGAIESLLKLYSSFSRKNPNPSV